MKRLLIACCVLGAMVPAAAGADDRQLVKDVATGALNRARRSIALGPFIGVSGVADPSGDSVELDAPISFGLELALFKVPIAPDPQMIREAIETRAKAIVAERIAAGATISEIDKRELLQRLALEVRDEVLARLNVRPRTFEKPRAALVLEGAYLPRASDGQFRTTLALGISRVTIGPTLLVHFGGSAAVAAGGELTLRALLKKAPRSPTLDMFIRADFAISDAAPAAIGLGARVLLDVI